jgi:ABC-type uncharacterized transport system substrate-binding protein
MTSGRNPSGAGRPANRGRVRLLLAALLVMLPLGAAQGHPHAWIDLRVSLMLGDDGRIHALRQEWVFDPTYSHLLLEDMDTSRPGLDLDTALRQMTARMLGNLRDHDYFTEVARDGQRLQIADARAGELLWRQRRLHLRFELPLDPIRPDRAQPLEYRVYDPSYWIEVLHDPHDVIHIEGGPGCAARIEQARPEGWLVAYAATLNRDQRAPVEDLGRSFAETVFIQCDQ